MPVTSLELALITYSSHLLSPAERRYSIHEKECLTVVCGYEKYQSHLEHKEFCLQMDNQALAWLLRHAKELGHIGRWVLASRTVQVQSPPHQWEN
jgi:hypothetical protein